MKMNNKIGLVLFLIGLNAFPPSNDLRGGITMIVMLVGILVFLWEGNQ